MMFFKKKPLPNSIKAHLVFMFKGKDGHDYFRWPKDLALSNERYILSLGLLNQLAKGLSGEEDEEFFKTLRELIAMGLKPEVFTKIAAAIELKEQSQSHIVHQDILVNLAAVFLVRGDEDPRSTNPDIFKQKLVYLENHISEDPHAFFLQMCIVELKHLQELSEEELNRQWKASRSRSEAVRKFLSNLLSVK